MLADVPELDVIAHQDGVANHNSLQNATAFFAALSKVAKAADPPRQLWSDLEAFDMPAPPAPPTFPYISEAVAPWRRISMQLAAERPHVDGFTVWEWHKYFSPIGGPQVADDPCKGAALSTVNSNASLHNYIELLRYRASNDGAVRSTPPPPLELASRHAACSTTPAPASSLGLVPVAKATAVPPANHHGDAAVGDGRKLTDGLPTWNMGGTYTVGQLRWGPFTRNQHHDRGNSSSAAAGAKGTTVTVRLMLVEPVKMCSAKLFALKASRNHTVLPANVTVTSVRSKSAGAVAGVPAPSPATYRLVPTTSHDDAVNVFYMFLPHAACEAAPATSTFEFSFDGEHGSMVAISEVEIYTSSAAAHTEQDRADKVVRRRQPQRQQADEMPDAEQLRQTQQQHRRIGEQSAGRTNLPPPALSRRRVALAPPHFEAAISDGGGATITVNGLTFDLTSSFSEVGPHWNTLQSMSPPLPVTHGWVTPPVVDRSAAVASGRWSVVAVARNYTLKRVFQLDPFPSPHRILVNDTIQSLVAADPIGVVVRHLASMSHGDVASVVVPGLLNPNYCGTEDNPSNAGGVDRDPHSTNSGAPQLWFNGTASARRLHGRSKGDAGSKLGAGDGGHRDESTAAGAETAAAIGIVALDDVFRVHAECSNLAVPQLNPRVPAQCAVNNPPAIRLSEPFLALPAGESHTLEWAVYPASQCTDWFCFVNLLRSDYGTDDIVIGEHTSPVSGLESGINAAVDDMTQWSRSGWMDPRCNNSDTKAERAAYCRDWTNWSTPELQHYMAFQGVNIMPIANAMEWGGSLPCGGHFYENGAAFVNGENPPTSGCGDCFARLEEKIRRVVRTAARVSTPEHPVTTSYYMHALISTGAADRETFQDARVLDVDGNQVLYAPCGAAYKNVSNSTAARQGELPLFFGNSTNSYGSILTQYVEKIFGLGVDGVFHDEYDYGKVAYTYGTWDNRTAFFNPDDLSIRALPGSITLLTLELELEIRKIIEAHRGYFTANGPPGTRTIMDKQSGVHFQENAEHVRVKHVQTYTPVVLNRDGQHQARDLDPKYNRGENVSGSDVCWNVVNHLDDGVLSYLYDGMMPKGANATIIGNMWPITVKELGDGFVIGVERVVTKASGTFSAYDSVDAPPPTGAAAGAEVAPGYTVYIYRNCVLVDKSVAGKDVPAALQAHVLPISPTTVAVSLLSDQQAVIVWGVGV